MRGRVRIFAVLLLTMPLAVRGLAAQSAAPAPDGIRLLWGLTISQPRLGDAAFAPFAALGDPVQAGPGIRAGLGYQLRGVELMGSAEYAGLDVGDPFERDGIPMGRRSSILRAYTLTLWLSPAALRFREYRGRVGAGILTGGVDNVSMTPDQLSGIFLDDARTVEDANDAHRTGISGSGFRLGVGAERDFSPDLALQAHLEVDRMSYDEFIYETSRFEHDLGTGWVPRLAVALRWAP